MKYLAQQVQGKQGKPCRRGSGRQGPRVKRSGVSLVELVIACLLIGTVASLILPTVSWTGVQRHAARQRQVACEELANLMDRLTSARWDEVTEQQVLRWGLDQQVQRQLPDAQLSAVIGTDQDVKRVFLSLTWSDRSARPVAPVRLTTWVYRIPLSDQPSSGDTASPGEEESP